MPNQGTSSWSLHTLQCISQHNAAKSSEWLPSAAWIPVLGSLPEQPDHTYFTCGSDTLSVHSILHNLQLIRGCYWLLCSDDPELWTWLTEQLLENDLVPRHMALVTPVALQRPPHHVVVPVQIKTRCALLQTPAPVSLSLHWVLVNNRFILDNSAGQASILAVAGSTKAVLGIRP